MHGLINQAIERFARDNYGDGLWEDLCIQHNLGFSAFEAMSTYASEVTDRVLDGLAQALDRSREEVLEDIGTYLVSSQSSGALRRLLRFSGTGFIDFLYSLDDLPARVRLAVPELDLPPLELREHTKRRFSLAVRSRGAMHNRFGHVMLGLLRAMADDYGALVLLDYKGARPGEEIIEITLLEEAFAEARAFELGAPTS